MSEQLCDCCERPLGDATDACPHCGVKFATPFAAPDAADRLTTAECHALIDQLRAQLATQQAAILKDLEFALAQLRHAYAQLTAHEKRWSRRGMQSFADGLLAPQIRRLEKVARLLGVKERRND